MALLSVKTCKTRISNLTPVKRIDPDDCSGEIAWFVNNGCDFIKFVCMSGISSVFCQRPTQSYWCWMLGLKSVGGDRQVGKS